MRDSVLGLVNPLIALIFAGIFFAIWRRSKRREVLAFAGAYALLGLGFLWSQFAPVGGGRLYMNASNLPYFLGTALLIWGAAGRVGKTVPVSLVASIGGTMVALLAIGVQFGELTIVDLYISNTAFGLLFMLGAQATAHSRKDNFADTLVFWMLVATSVQFLVRPSLSFMFEGPLVHETYRESIYYSVLNAVVALNSMGLAVSLMAAAGFDSFQSEREAASRDPLSGLLTRREFENQCRAIFERAEERGVPLALVIGDIDHFKQVNDIWGHQVGDNAISQFGQLVLKTSRDSDVAGRIGGEEFCILVWNADGRVAKLLAERLRVTISALQIDGMGNDIRLTSSFGCAARNPQESYASLFKRADTALYEAKNNGRNRIESADDILSSASDAKCAAKDVIPMEERRAVGTPRA